MISAEEESKDRRWRRTPPEAMVGKTFGRLTVLARSDRRYMKNRLYHCLCECGSEVYEIGHRLRKGLKKSCGCLPTGPKTDRPNPGVLPLPENFVANKRVRDLSGKRFGMYAAIRPIGSDINRNILWLCRCDCGAERRIPTNNLVSGNSTNCGCVHGRTPQRIGRELV